MEAGGGGVFVGEATGASCSSSLVGSELPEGGGSAGPSPGLVVGGGGVGILVLGGGELGDEGGSSWPGVMSSSVLESCEFKMISTVVPCKEEREGMAEAR